MTVQEQSDQQTFEVEHWLFKARQTKVAQQVLALEKPGS